MKAICFQCHFVGIGSAGGSCPQCGYPLIVNTEAVALTARDLEICRTIGPELKRRGLLFVGIDVIGDYLTEINVTSPTGGQQLKRFGGADVAALLWDRIEAIRARESA